MGIVIDDEKLLQLQQESKQRHELNKLYERINPVCFLSAREFATQVIEIIEKTSPFDLIKKIRFIEIPKGRLIKKFVPKPEKIIMRPKETPVIEMKPLVRPKAEYSNKSPYGIASELLLLQGK